MGKWQQEYERQWKTYTTDVLRAHFGRQYSRYEVTTSDKYELRDQLRTMGSSYDPFVAQPPRESASTKSSSRNGGSRRRRSSVRFHTPARKGHGSYRRLSSIGSRFSMNDESCDGEFGLPMTQVLTYTERQGDDSNGNNSESERQNDSDASMQSDVSYVYQTPQPKAKQLRRRQRSPANAISSVERQRKRSSHGLNISNARSSTSTFPAFTPRDLNGSRDHTRLSTESASQSLQRRLASMSPIERLRYSTESTAESGEGGAEPDESVVLFTMGKTQAPPTGGGGRGRLGKTTVDDDAAAPRSIGLRPHQQEEHNDKEPPVVDLDVSMQSLHLEEDDDDEDEDDAMEPKEAPAQEQAEPERVVAAALDFNGASDDDDDDDEQEVVTETAAAMEVDVDAGEGKQQQQATASPRGRWHWSEATMQGESESTPMREAATADIATAVQPQPQPAEQEIIEINDDDDDEEPEPESYDFGGDMDLEIHAETNQDDSVDRMVRQRLRNVGLALSDDDDDTAENVDATGGGGKRADPFESSTVSANKGSPTASSSSSSSSPSTSDPKKKNLYYRTKLPLTVEANSTHIDDRRRERRRQKLKKKLDNHTMMYRMPDCRAELAPYQRDAVDWMLRREEPGTNNTTVSAAAPPRLDGDDTQDEDDQDVVCSSSRRRQREKYYDRLTAKMRGGILADEMGLGKTVCCLAVICESLKKVQEELQSMEESSGSGGSGTASSSSSSSIPRLKPPTLIITPLSILGQWEKEIQDKTNLSVICYQGSTRRQIHTVMDFMGVDVVLSTYDTLRLKECKVSATKAKNNKKKKRTNDNDDEEQGEDEEEEGSEDLGTLFDELNNSKEWHTAVRRRSDSKKAIAGSKLHQLTWYRVILDESHLITNPSCARARAALFLRSKRRWCVTGTPIQNSGNDLSSLMTFLGMRDQKGSFTQADFQEVLSRVMLRRLKSTVDTESNEPIVQLPPKQEEIMELEFASELESAYYMVLHRSTKKRVFQYLRSRNGNGNGGGGQFMHVFELLLRLRQCCDACQLVSDDPKRDVQDGNGALLAEIGTLSRQDAALLERAGRADAHNKATNPSTKIKALLKEVKQMKRTKEHGLVISQWTSYLDLIADAIHEENNCKSKSHAGGGGSESPPITFCRLDGSMSSREREQAIASFQVEKRVDLLLVSLRTGGLGLNLTTASHVFIMEPSWNPSMESQAVDRAHRVGQTKRVRVVRFLMKNTIEERVVELQRKKKALAAVTLGDAAALATCGNSQATQMATQKEAALTRDELRALFSQDVDDDGGGGDDEAGEISEDME